MTDGTPQPAPQESTPVGAASVTFGSGRAGNRFNGAVVGQAAALAARAAIVVCALIMLVALVGVFAGHDVPWAAIAVVGGVVFVAVVVLIAAVSLFATTRIEFRPASSPTHVRLIRSLGTKTIPIARVRGLTLTDQLEQSPAYPYTLSSSGSVTLRLELHDGAVISGPVREPVERLAGRLTELLRPAGVPVEAGAAPRAGCDPDIVDDRLPPDGIVLAIMRRRPSRGDIRKPHPGYLSAGETEEAWPSVWSVQKVAEANRVRLRWFVAGSHRQSIYWADFRAVDVQRVADEIAAGTAVVDPSWRGDTEDGQAAKAAFLKAHGHR